jgi:hypothetical protein
VAGIPVGYLLAFPLKRGAARTWKGFTAGLYLAICSFAEGFYQLESEFDCMLGVSYYLHKTTPTNFFKQTSLL